MTQYASRTDFARFGLPTTATQGIPPADLDAALVAASSELDGYLRAAGYRLPLSTWGDDLRRNVCARAAYDVLVTRGLGPGDGADEHVRTRSEDARGWARDVAAKRIVPDGIVDAGLDAPSDAAEAFADTSDALWET